MVRRPVEVAWSVQAHERSSVRSLNGLRRRPPRDERYARWI